MDLRLIERQCQEIGKVIKVSKNDSVFGNIEIWLETPEKKTLVIVSDRGEFLCYLARGNHTLSPMKCAKHRKPLSFSSLEALLDFLKGIPRNSDGANCNLKS